MNSFSSQVRGVIDAHLPSLKESRLLAAARRGALVKDDFRVYFTNLYFLFEFTPVCLERSMALSKARSYPDQYIQYLHDKIKEETGHHKWAEEDLNSIGFGSERIQESELTAGIRELMTFVNGIIEEDPMLYLSYMLCAEYITVALGPEFIQDCEKKCGLVRKRISSIDHHVTADREHVSDDLKVFDQIPLTESQKTRLLKVTEESVKRILGFFDSIPC